jgi:hypothetical protein
MSGVIVEDQLDGRIRGIEPLEEADELAGAMPILDTGMDLPGQRIDARKQAQRAMALVFVVAREALVDARFGRQVGCGVADRLDARLLIVGNDRDIAAFGGIAFAQHRDFPIAAEHFGHLRRERRVAALQVVAHLVWLDLVAVEDLADRALRDVRQRWMSGGYGVVAAWRASSRVVQSSCGYPRSLAFWQANETSHARAASVISGALPGRGLSSSAAITPSRRPRRRQRSTV